MPADGIFRIASQTKALASVGVMMLQEEGKLLVTDPIGKYLPAFADTKVAAGERQWRPRHRGRRAGRSPSATF